MKILLTGASGVMGLATLRELVDAKIPVRAFCLDQPRELQKIRRVSRAIELFPGDLRCYEDVYRSLDGVDMILHCGGIIPPLADKDPKLTMQINYGAVRHILRALRERGREQSCRLVFISSVAVYGDRQPPIHWCRIGDPIKCSYYDYYSLSKIACERLIIESNVKDWVILRQTGVLSPSMIGQRSSLIFHQPLTNVLEYLSDRDSGRLLCRIVQHPELPIWGNLYNLGGGTSLRLPFFRLFQLAFGSMGFPNISRVLDPKCFAQSNFHGVYYLDSHLLNDLYSYVEDGSEYIRTCSDRYLKGFGGLVRALMHITPLRRLADALLRRQLLGLSRAENGPLRMIEEEDKDRIQAFFIDRTHWENTPAMEQLAKDIDYEKQAPLSHGYDESKPAKKLSIEDMRAAAAFRGGLCQSESMQEGDWKTPLSFCCANHHRFQASPTLVLKGGHWCPECEKKSWKPQEIAASNPFFAQVWYPLHSKDEPLLEVKKVIDEDAIV